MLRYVGQGKGKGGKGGAREITDASKGSGSGYVSLANIRREGSRQQAAGSRQQAAGSWQQAAGSRQQAAGSRH
jgi:hypothetical protein